MNIKRLIVGDEFRISRFHDEKGNFVGRIAFVTFPAAILYRLLSFAHVNIVYPWLGFSATRYIRKLIQPEWTILEFGSGMSTPWWARRSKLLISREDNEAWHKRIEPLLRKNTDHLQYEFAQDERYYDLSAFPDGYFDFILVDGSHRSECINASIPKLKSGGYIYLDNSDKDMTIRNGDLRKAEAALLEAVRDRKGTARYFTDFAPGNMTPQQGLLARLP